MRLKRPAQPLVFQFQRAGSLCAAVACLYQAWPKLEASLCLYRGAYYLKAAAALRQRQSVRRLAAPFGKPLGACPVFYAYCEEHGRCLSTNAVEELGGALWGRGLWRWAWSACVGGVWRAWSLGGVAYWGK